MFYIKIFIFYFSVCGMSFVVVNVFCRETCEICLTYPIFSAFSVNA